MRDELYDSTQNAIKKGSKSFSFAALFFDSATRRRAYFLYAWCRHCDDQIDDVEDPIDQRERLSSLRSQTEKSLLDENVPDYWVFQAFQDFAKGVNLPTHYPMELLEGMRMDIERTQYKTIRDLELYCYRVASVVGLMMCHAMGLSDQRALRNASALGMAMQMTNIARDVVDDARMGRVYLPENWLAEEEVDSTPAAVLKLENREKVFRVVQRLLDRADELYSEGLEGVIYLPFRAGLAVTAASVIYREIGVRIRRRKRSAWETRTIVPLGTKILLLGSVGLRMFKQLHKRITVPWKSVPIETVWRFQ